MNQREIVKGLTIAGQPSAEDIARLRDEGFRTIVNLRLPDDEGILEDEEHIVEGSGLNYAAIPVSPKVVDDLAVMRFSQAISSTDSQPALIHCGSGGRAGIMLLLHMAIEHGWSLERALEEGKKLGDLAPSETSPYRPFFESYIKRHSAGERTGE
jgi:uncharacterized protein (TIGR01244 family)